MAPKKLSIRLLGANRSDIGTGLQTSVKSVSMSIHYLRLFFKSLVLFSEQKVQMWQKPTAYYSLTFEFAPSAPRI